MLTEIEKVRLKIGKATDPHRKSHLGQFFTSAGIARFMAGLFREQSGDRCRLLDAGAGIGSLSAAFLERCTSGCFGFSQVELDAFEIDESLHPHLNQTLEPYRSRQGFAMAIHGADFVHAAVERQAGSLFAEAAPNRYTHAILNPPYKKIGSNTDHRSALRSVGIETVNLYSAFVALALSLLEDGGELVAIVPRSFCNGPYYLPFREYLLRRAAIRRLHLFESRDQAFKDDDVLQENLIVHLERGGVQGPVTVSTSTDDRFEDLVLHEHAFSAIVNPRDPERFIHVPTTAETKPVGFTDLVHYSLAEIGITVSTGPVVDFRLKEHLRDMPEAGAVPLLYPGHFGKDGVEWPKLGAKKPNAIQRNGDTERWLFPNGHYCVVRRFSSKEERHRIIPNVVDPSALANAPVLGFENHLNVFHERRQGLPEALAHGLRVFLESTAVDRHFRRFSGHTQVNATDLKSMRYPSRETLIALGEWAMARKELTQAAIDARVEFLTG